MPPKKPLKLGYVSSDAIAAIEKFVVKTKGDAAKYTQLVDSMSLGVELPCEEPRWVMLVDTAEPDHISLVQRLRLCGIFAVAQTVQSTEYCGDFVVLERLLDNDEPPLYAGHLDVERKSVPDFLSSFFDGRRERQRAQHAASAARRHGYIIEGRVGDLFGTPRASMIKAINTDLDGLAFSSPFSLRQIDTHADLIPSLCNMMHYIARGSAEKEAGIDHFLAHAFSGKKAVRNTSDPATVWSGILQSFPGISPAAANAIVETQYPTLVSFCQAVVNASEDPDARASMVKTLSDVKVRSTNAASSRGETRLGARAEKLMDIAVPTDEEPKPPPPPVQRKKRVISSDDDDVIVRRKPKAALWDDDD